MQRDLDAMRRAATGDSLDEDRAGNDPIDLLDRWLADAAELDDPEPNAMVVATVDGAGHPTARVVLVKRFDARGLAFYTNLESVKGRAAAEDGRASGVLYWPPLHRQVRVEGRLEPVPDEEADAYYASRPRDSQIGAWASPQSRRIPDRAELEARVAEVTERFGDGTIPRPPFWGGLRLVPSRFEFWQGRANRLHDRIVFLRDEDEWTRERLAP